MYAQDSAKTKSSMRTLPLVGSFAEYFREVKAAQERNKKVCDNCYNYEYDGRVFVDELGDLMKPHDLMGYFPPAYAKARFKAYAFSRSPPLSRKACAAAFCRSPGRANAALRRFLSRPSNPSPFYRPTQTGHPFGVSRLPPCHGHGVRSRVGFSAKATGSLSSRRRCLAPSLPGAGKRRTAAFASPPFESLPFYRPKQQDTLFQGVLLLWRRGWDSNPRDVSAKLISSQPRYDHFDTSARGAVVSIQEITANCNALPERNPREVWHSLPPARRPTCARCAAGSGPSGPRPTRHSPPARQTRRTRARPAAG